MRNASDLLLQGPGVDTAPCLIYRGATWSYGRLRAEVLRLASAMQRRGVSRSARVAVLLDKRPEAVALILAAAHLGAIAVPVNPQLKASQVAHILTDSGSCLLVTTVTRLRALDPALLAGRTVVLCGGGADETACVDYDQWSAGAPSTGRSPVLDGDPALLLYTSGSTGLPKGAAVTHRNLIAGAASVNEYLGTTADDVLLGALPLSFDAGLSQLTTALSAGGQVVLHDYLLPHEVPTVCARHGVTCITAVPPLWSELIRANWPHDARSRVRLFATTGGRMPLPLLALLRALFRTPSRI